MTINELLKMLYDYFQYHGVNGVLQIYDDGSGCVLDGEKNEIFSFYDLQELTSRIRI